MFTCYPTSQSVLALAVVALQGVVCAGCGTEPVPRLSSGVRINELCPRNRATSDDAGHTGDWIELVNLGPSPVNLAGYYLSDDVDTRFTHVLSDAVSIPGDGVVLFWADETPEAGPLHLSFRLSAGGEGVWLSNPQGYVVDAIEYGPAPSSGSGGQDLSFARHPNATGQFQWCGAPTPEQENGNACAEPLP